MILKPFAWLVEIVVVIILTAIHTVYCLIIGVFFVGPLFMYLAIVNARESNILHTKYINEGVSVDGVVMRRYNTWREAAGGGDGPSHVLVEHAIVKYEYGNDEYLMKLSPLREHVKDSIEPQGMIPIVLLRENPKSGIPEPEVCVASIYWSPLSRILLFTFGLAISAMSSLPCLLLYMLDLDWRIIVAIVLLVGTLPIALIFFWKGFRDWLRPTMSLNSSRGVEVRKLSTAQRDALMAVISRSQN